MPNFKKNEPTQTKFSDKKKENVDDPNSLSHEKFHTHGIAQPDGVDKETALSYLNELNRKKKAAPEGGVKLRSVTINKEKEQPQQLYFMLSTIALLLITILIIAGCLAAVYLFGGLFYQNRLRAYSQYTDEEEGQKEIEMIQRADVLSKIEEENEEDNESVQIPKKKQDDSKNSTQTRTSMVGVANPEYRKSKFL